MAVRGIRGAITVAENSASAIEAAVRELLTEIKIQNDLDLDDVACALFTATPDLDASFPAAAARRMGWERVPLMCAVEMGVPDSLPRCIRVLVMVNTTRSQDQLRHVYLREARSLRPDLG